VAETDEQAFVWYEALQGYWSEVQEKMQLDRDREHAEKQKELEQIRRELEKTRQAFQEEQATMEANLEAQQSALKQRRKSLEQGKAALDKEMSKVTQERDQLMARVEELTQSVMRLGKELDARLGQNAQTIQEIESYRPDKLALARLKAELEAEQHALKNNSELEEMTRLLRDAIQPRWGALHTAIHDDLNAAAVLTSTG